MKIKVNFDDWKCCVFGEDKPAVEIKDTPKIGDSTAWFLDEGNPILISVELLEKLQLRAKVINAKD